MQSNVIILGKPGAGKSTACKKLSSDHGVLNIDFGEYLREIASDKESLLGRYVSTFWSRNNLKEIGFEYFDSQFDRCLADGIHFILSSPKVLEDAREIDEHMKQKGIQIDAVIELEAPSDVCITRMESKGNENGEEKEEEEKENDDQKEVTYPVSEKIDHFEKHIEDIRSFYKRQPHITYLTINSNQDTDDVVKEILEKVQQVEKKKADYSHLDEIPKEVDEEASDEFFERLHGTPRAELVQLMLELAHNPKPKIPMTHPVPLFGGNLNELRNRQYAVVRKLEGERRLLVVYEDKIYSVSGQYNAFLCKLSLPESPSCNWNNTLFDAEIVRSKEGVASIFILDCLCASGTSVRNEKLASRLTFVKKFTDDYKESNCPISIYMQTYFTLAQLPLLTRLGRNGDPSNPVPSARVVAQGLIFVPTTLRYNIGSSRFLLTWKPAALNTVDFAAFKETDDEEKPYLSLKSYNYKETSYSAQAKIQSIPKGFEDMPDGTVIECNYQNDEWKIFKVRKDKTFPNADWIVQEAMEYAKNPVTQQKLLEKVHSIIKDQQKQNTRRNKQNNSKRRF